MNSQLVCNWFSTGLLTVACAAQEKQPVVCHRDGKMRHGVVYSVLKDGLQFLAVVHTSNAVPTSVPDPGDSLDSFL